MAVTTERPAELLRLSEVADRLRWSIGKVRMYVDQRRVRVEDEWFPLHSVFAGGERKVRADDVEKIRAAMDAALGRSTP